MAVFSQAALSISQTVFGQPGGNGEGQGMFARELKEVERRKQILRVESALCRQVLRANYETLARFERKMETGLSLSRKAGAYLLLGVPLLRNLIGRKSGLI